MKVSISTAPQICNTATTTTGKPLSYDDTTTFRTLNTTPFVAQTTSCYEPTSVLDIQRSPSPCPCPCPATAPPPSDHPSLVDLDNSEGWDSIFSEIGFNVDLSQLSSCDSNLSQIPTFPTSQPFDPTFSDIQHLDVNFPPLDDLPYTNNGVGLESSIDDLIRAAQSFESNDSNQVHLILSLLNQRLRSPLGKPLQRAAFYFKEALQHLVSSQTQATQLSSLEVVHTIHAFKTFSGISPVTLFSAFSANQAILEALHDSTFIHVVDFDIGFGGHWASFMKELMDKLHPSKIGSMVFRITAIIPDEFGIDTKLVVENLTQFARELNINFYIDFVSFRSFQVSSFESVMLMEGERIAIHLSTSVFHRIRQVSKFVTDLRRVSPRVVVVVDKEVGIDVGTMSFSTSFIAGLEFYNGMIESLDVAATAVGLGVADCMRIETYVLRPRIMAAVEAAATAAGRRTTWREAFVEAGMRAVGFSQFADFQAECLLRRAQVGGFRAAKRHGEMMLCWHDQALVATSAWKCL